MRFHPDGVFSPPPLCCIADWIGLGVVCLILLALVFA